MHDGLTVAVGDHLIAVEGKRSEVSESAAAPSFIGGAECLGSILKHRGVPFLRHLEEAVVVGGHSVEAYRDDGFRFPACSFDPIGYGFEGYNH